MKTFTTWKSIEIGKYKTIEALKEAVRKNNTISLWAEQILDKISLSPKKKINIVKMTVEELGFPNGATTKEIFEKAEKLGLKLCPPEVAAYLRIEYTDQPLYKWLVIAMEPIKDSDGYPDLLGAHRRGSKSYLYACYDGPDDEWDRGHGFAFSQVESSEIKSSKLLDTQDLVLRIEKLEQKFEEIANILK